jgi:hypothetical protein
MPGRGKAKKVDKDFVALVEQLPDSTLFAFLAAAGTGVSVTPNTYEEAIASPDANKWIAAMTKEVNGLVKMGTWRLVRAPVSVQVLPGRWVFKVKFDADGKPCVWKAR